jgi:hypothetical protein
MAPVSTGTMLPASSAVNRMPSLIMLRGPAADCGAGWFETKAHTIAAAIARMATVETVGISHRRRRSRRFCFSRSIRAASRAASRRWFFVWRSSGTLTASGIGDRSRSSLIEQRLGTRRPGPGLQNRMPKTSSRS